MNDWNRVHGHIARGGTFIHESYERATDVGHG